MEGKQILQTATVLSVKIKFNEDIRRLSCPATVAWENLKAEVLAKYGLDPKAKVCLKYEDEEGDLITLGCEADFHEALNIISATKLLRLTIVKVKRECAPTKSVDVASSVDVVSAVPATTTTATTPRAPVTGVPGKILTKEEFKLLKKEHKHEKHEKHEKHAHKHKHEDKAQLKEAKRAMKEQLKACKAARGTKYVARFVKDVATLDETELAPETTFVKTWRFRNEGDCAWPEGCKLLFVSKLNGDQMGAPASVPVTSAAVGQEIDVSVPMVAPATPGRYVGFWRLCTADGQKFGQRVRVLIQVTSTSSSSSDSTSSSSEDDATNLAPLLLQMEQMGFTDKEKNTRVLKKHQGNLASAVAFLGRKQQLKAEKAAQKAAEKAEKKARKAAEKATKEKAKHLKKEAKSAASTPRK